MVDAGAMAGTLPSHYSTDFAYRWGGEQVPMSKVSLLGMCSPRVPEWVPIRHTQWTGLAGGLPRLTMKFLFTFESLL